MKSTSTQYGAKSETLPQDMTLSRLPEQDFWSFYLANRKSLDHIIAAQIVQIAPKFPNVYPFRIEATEIHDEVLIEFDRLGTLDGYDSPRSSLNTWVTNNVNFYVRRALKKAIGIRPWERMRSRDGTLARYNDGTVVKRYLSRHLTADINGMLENPDEENLSELACQDDFVDENSEMNHVSRDIIEKLKTGEQKSSQEILDRLVEGLSAKEIAKCFEVTRHAINNKIISFRKKTKELLSLSEPRKIVKEPVKPRRVLVTKITEPDRKEVRKWWFARGGIIGWNDMNDFCQTHKNLVKRGLTVHQITGVLGTLHRELAKGKICVKDLKAYNANRAERGQTTCCKYVGKCQRCGLCKVSGTLCTRERAAK